MPSRSSSPSTDEDVSMRKEVEFLNESYKLLMKKTVETNQLNEMRFGTVEDSLKEILTRLDKRAVDE